MTGTIVAPAGSWSCVSHQQSPVFILLYIRQLSDSARCTGSKSRCTCNGWWAKRNCIHSKISLLYNVPKMCKWSSIQLWLPGPKLSVERSFHRASADWNDSMVKLSSPSVRCWSIHVFVCWLTDRACWKLWAEWKGCHGFHFSEYLRCLLHNPVALPSAFLHAFSTPSTSLWVLVFVRSGVQVRSGFCGSIVSSSGVSSGGGATGTLSMGRWISWLSSSMPIQVHWLKSNHDGSGWSQSAGI